MATRLTDDQISDAIETLDGWTLHDGKLHKRFEFDGFSAAFGFLARVALAAESAGHHPELANVYDTVEIDLVTHDVDGISELDVEMARSIDAIRND